MQKCRATRHADPDGAGSGPADRESATRAAVVDAPGRRPGPARERAEFQCVVQEGGLAAKPPGTPDAGRGGRAGIHEQPAMCAVSAGAPAGARHSGGGHSLQGPCVVVLCPGRNEPPHLTCRVAHSLCLCGQHGSFPCTSILQRSACVLSLHWKRPGEECDGMVDFARRLATTSSRPKCVSSGNRCRI